MLSAILLTAVLSPARPAAAEVTERAMSAGPVLAPFDQLNADAGTLTSAAGAYTGARSARATYTGGGTNGYARGIFNVGWGAGDDVWYHAAFKLPKGFKAAMQGQVALLRWDDWASHPVDTDHGGIVIYGGDKHAYLVRERLTQDDQRPLVGAFDVPEGRWFLLEVHQRLASADAAALNEVYLDGRLVGSSTAANLSPGRTVERLRVGLVAIASGAQRRPLSLRFDDATIGRSGPARPRPGTVFSRVGEGPLPIPGGARIATPVRSGVGLAAPALPVR